MSLLTSPAGVDQETDTLEKTVPAHLIQLAIEECVRQGYEFRSDIQMRLDQNIAAKVSKYADGWQLKRIARRIDDTASACLRRLNADDAKEMLYCAAMFSLVLVDEGLLDDPANIAVLVALLLMEDAKDENKDEQGNQPLYALAEARWRSKAKEMLVTAHLSGLYLKRHKLCN